MMIPALLLAAAQAASAQSKLPPDTLATVDGIAITRQDVVNRLWAKGADQALNQIIDELAFNKALSAWRVGPGKKETKSVQAEVAARLKRIKGQFKDEAAYAQALQRNGVQAAAVEVQLREQIETERLIVSAKKLSVSDAEVKQFYEANKDKLGGPEAVRLRHLVVADERQAKDLLLAARVGADFAKLAQQVSLDASTKEKGGDLGFVAASMLNPEVAKAVFALKPGELSEPLRMADGYHLFKAEERRQPQQPRLEDVRKDLAQALLEQKISQAWPGYLAEVRTGVKVEPVAAQPVKR